MKENNTIIKAIISCTTRSIAQRQWWQETLTTIEKLSTALPFYSVPIGQPDAIIHFLHNYHDQRGHYEI
jgi:hypothetical protein